MVGNRNDSVIIAALLTESTVEEAVSVTKANPRTLYRRLESPEFQVALDDVTMR